MPRTTDDPRVTRETKTKRRRQTHHAPGVTTLWFGIFTGPAAALLMLQTGYIAVPWACRQHANAGAMALLHLVPFVLLLATVTAGWGAWHQLRALGRCGEEPSHAVPDVTGRLRFMAQLGVASGVLFALVLVAQWTPVFILHPCQRG